jgi:hypothetical protein
MPNICTLPFVEHSKLMDSLFSTLKFPFPSFSSFLEHLIILVSFLHHTLQHLNEKKKSVSRILGVGVKGILVLEDQTNVSLSRSFFSFSFFLFFLFFSFSVFFFSVFFFSVLTNVTALTGN